MSATTPEQVEALAKKYISATDLDIIVVGEAKDIRPGLEKIGTVITYDQDLKPVK